MEINNGTWKDVIYLISLLVGNDYIIRNIKIKEYNSCQIEDNNREWSIEDGEVLLLGKREDISSIPNNKVYNICDLRKNYIDYMIIMPRLLLVMIFIILME